MRLDAYGAVHKGNRISRGECFEHELSPIDEVNGEHTA